MTLVTIPGVYANGKIELTEKPEGVAEADVLVTFLPSEQSANDAEQAADSREAARRRAFARMRQGIDLDGKFSREDIYASRMQELDARRNQSQ